MSGFGVTPYFSQPANEIYPPEPLPRGHGLGLEVPEGGPSYPTDCSDPIYYFSPLEQNETGKDFYAVLYGDVTGNWAAPLPGPESVLLMTAGNSPEAAAADQILAEQLKQAGAPGIERSGAGGPAELWVSDWPAPLRAGEQRQVVINLSNADGILGLDLTDLWTKIDGASRSSLARSVEQLALPERLRAGGVLGLAAEPISALTIFP